jgi:hypothetical protein
MSTLKTFTPQMSENAYSHRAPKAGTHEQPTRTFFQSAAPDALEDAILATPLPRELTESTPRRVRVRQETQKARRWTANGLGACLLLLTLVGQLNVARVQEVATQGVQTTATVESKQVHKGKSNTYYLNESFLARFHNRVTTVHTSERVSQSVFNAVSVGATRSVKYLPRNFNIHYFGTVNQDAVAARQATWTTVILGGLGLTLFGFWGWNVHLNKRKRLLSIGIATVGVVDKQRVVEGKTNTYHVTFRYRVNDKQRGTTIERKTTHSVSKEAYEKLELGMAQVLVVDPHCTWTAVPYNLLTEVEVEGAAPRTFL